VAAALAQARQRLLEPPSEDEIMVARSGDARTVIQVGEIVAAVIVRCELTYQN
jgi:hypothetical protein